MTTLEVHFGLNKLPFPKAVTDATLLSTRSLEHALSQLHFALQRDTIATIIAESGCSKSTILYLFAKSLDAASYYVL
ncbi:MAG: hypothetical protein V2A73_17650, partial [Pseudomonadota bacterium]